MVPLLMQGKLTSIKYTTMSKCYKCQNDNEVLFKWEKHRFKNGTYHIKMICLVCSSGSFVKKTMEGYAKTKDTAWITDHSKKARKERQREYKNLTQQINLVIIPLRHV